jgi:cytochrome c-type biogenesis protein CcmE
MAVTDQPVLSAEARRQRKRLAFAGVAILGALGFLVAKGLGNATVYFKTTTEAVKERSSLGSRRFRLEGIVDDASVREVGDAVQFTISQDGAAIAVEHRGDPPELFQCNIPVVLEGRFADRAAADVPLFESDRILIKHDNVYQEANPERLKEFVGKDKYRCSKGS